MDPRDAAGSMGRDAIAAALKASGGARFFALVGDDDEREIKAAKTRGRWERLHDAAHGLGASAIVCRDDDGATLAVVRLDALEDTAPPSSTPTLDAPRASGTSGELAQLLALVLRAQDAAVARQAEQQAQVTSAALDVMRAAADRAQAMERTVLALVSARERELDAASRQLEEQARAIERADARAAARAAADDDDTFKELDRMGETLIREAVVPALGSKLALALAPKPGKTA